MATPAPVRHRDAEDGHDRAQPPLRWPHFHPLDLVLAVGWAAGLVVALAVPATLVDPTARTAPAGHVALVYGVVLGAVLVMIGTTTALSRRRRQWGVLVLGAVPAVVCLLYAVLITIAKIQS